MLIRCLPTVLLAAALFPAHAYAEPLTFGTHSVEAGATALLPTTLSIGETTSLGEITLPTGDSSVALEVDGLAANSNYLMELTVYGADSLWTSLKAELLDPLDGDDELDVEPYHSGVPDGFSTSNTRDGLSFAQSAGLVRSAEFAGGSATVIADETTNGADALIFSGLLGVTGPITLTFGLRDYDGGRNFLVRFSVEAVEESLHTPEPASMLLLGTGLAGVFAARRRRPQRSEAND